ncbi:serine/threonine-protein kinase [Psychrobacter sp. S1-30-MNA-CIBAN-0213]|uniref:serine/threonine-protein kinase n=1 Tax=Psychrobacter sp. S1-30-MNA-CIBAN-0213 TaxID=3140456 RepID=UPI003317A683
MNNILMNGLPTRYILDGESESGGFSDVFYCHDTHLERKVAIKTIRDADQARRLDDEIEALLKIRSKHVVQVFDVIRVSDIATDMDTVGIVLEYINGEDLVESKYHLQSHNDLLKVLWQIASGISDIHDAKLIHRDIKPNNMKLDSEGIVKIFDFGLSRNSGLDAVTFGFKGTQGFSAPEQYTHQEVNFTSAIDIYAFGISALYLATQDIPKPLLEMPPKAAPINSFDCPYLDPYPTLKVLFENCLAHDPTDRPDIADITNEISKYLLFNKHQAIVVMDGNTNLLNSLTKSAKLKYGTIGSFEIEYTGHDFVLKNVVGEVFVNNEQATSGRKIPGACVIGLGSKQRQHFERRFVTFDVSNPEVTL